MKNDLAVMTGETSSNANGFIEKLLAPRGSRRLDLTVRQERKEEEKLTSRRLNFYCLASATAHNGLFVLNAILWC